MNRKLVIGGVVFVGALLVVLTSLQDCSGLSRWLGPPQVTLTEAYEAEGADFDHTDLTVFLTAYVDEAGLVDYEGALANMNRLDAYLARVGAVDFDALSRDAKLALLINAYNAFTLKLVAEHRRWIISIREISKPKRWAHARWVVGGRTMSLNDIYDGHLRAKFKEPRVHFALCNGSLGAPPLQRTAYTAANLEAQLQAQVQRVHDDERWFKFDEKRLELTRIYMWYADDFIQVAGHPLKFAARYSPALAARIQGDKSPILRWMKHDWHLNSLVPTAEKKNQFM